MLGKQRKGRDERCLRCSESTVHKTLYRMTRMTGEWDFALAINLIKIGPSSFHAKGNYIKFYLLLSCASPLCKLLKKSGGTERNRNRRCFIVLKEKLSGIKIISEGITSCTWNMTAESRTTRERNESTTRRPICKRHDRHRPDSSFSTASDAERESLSDPIESRAIRRSYHFLLTFATCSAALRPYVPLSPTIDTRPVLTCIRCRSDNGGKKRKMREREFVRCVEQRTPPRLFQISFVHLSERTSILLSRRNIFVWRPSIHFLPSVELEQFDFAIFV